MGGSCCWVFPRPVANQSEQWRHVCNVWPNGNHAKRHELATISFLCFLDGKAPVKGRETCTHTKEEMKQSVSRAFGREQRYECTVPDDRRTATESNEKLYQPSHSPPHHHPLAIRAWETPPTITFSTRSRGILFFLSTDGGGAFQTNWRDRRLLPIGRRRGAWLGHMILRVYLIPIDVT
jgi:hypothetical protein